MSGSEHDEARPVLRIVRGNPSPEELAALVVVLSAASGGGESEEPVAPVAPWATPERLHRRPVAPLGWWESSLPR